MRIAIIYHRIFDSKSGVLIVGGIQTYLLALARLCRELGWAPTLYQYSDTAFEHSLDGIPVIGVAAPHPKISRKIKCVYARVLSDIDARKDIVIFGADHCSLRAVMPRSILIQHGISWDLPISLSLPGRRMLGPMLKYFFRAKLMLDAVVQFNHCRYRVCVDYNFLNWYRTIVDTPMLDDVWVVPNACEIPPNLPKQPGPGSSLRVIFARRFVEYRGTRLMERAAQVLLKKYPDLHFTFAGEGPEESRLKGAFAGQNRVTFIKYAPDDAHRILGDHDIAVVPSVASEGTSLSVAEAMASGCAVVATAVGGVTNMLIDRYNGILVQPRAEALVAALEYLINEPALREQIAKRGRETAEMAFSNDRWKNQWREVIVKVAASS